ncbi:MULTISPECIES: hypothetical protein [unclassified Duganella]|uniref:hypothetical protein n=1 Tax=unclassified Duganella TaxID=2636909 RepID=UPI000E342788|nr:MULTISPECIES: hypothetical protein [unclassified Duganella]RFP14928.1 hypothetical protein D0T23_13095 [Duganella sp. BJB475]RFP31278.1 hypothetical protein D0T21_15475 [Duganella sp. BJB476]
MIIKLSGSKATLIVSLAACLFLSGCGGGGGGASTNSGNGGGEGEGGNDPAPGFSVSINRSELRFEGDERGYINAQVVLGNASGSTTANVYTGALDLGTAIDHVSQEIVGTQLKFTVYPKTTLAAGEYKGTLQLFACADDKCAHHFTGSPQNVPYTVTVHKGMSVSPSSLSLAVLSGATASGEVSVQLPPGISNFAATTTAPWMSASTTGTGSVKLTTKPLPPGSYSGALTISTPGRTIDVPVKYNVGSDGNTQTQLSSDTSNFSFTATAGGVAASKRFNVTLPSWTNELSAEASYYGDGKGWLSVVKSGDRSYTLNVSAADLPAGTYYAQVVLRSGYLTTPLTLPVTLSVGSASWSISGNTTFTVGPTTDKTTQTSVLKVDLPNLPAQGWNASSSADWLKLANASGTTGSTALQVVLDVPAMLQLPNSGTYKANITISSTSGKVPPTTVGFTLSKNLPAVNYASPHLRLPNEGGPVILRGSGFDSVTDLGQALQVNGAQVNSITRVSDTQLLLQVGAAASGSATFSIANALGVDTGKASIKVVPSTSYAYKAIATAGVKGGIVYDAERQSVYTANKTLGSVMRFAYAGGAWTTTAAALPTIESVALSPDGASIVATATSGKIVLFDPVTLAVQNSYPVPAGVVRDNAYYPGPSIDGYNSNSSPTLVMANNGKAFFQGSGGSLGGLAYFDLVNHQYGGITMPILNFYPGSNANLSMSGDGSRLLLGYQSNDSQNSMLYMDTNDQLVKSNGAGIGYWYSGAQSLHGERISSGMTNIVWDKDFNLIGNSVPDQFFGSHAAVFSPDGMRLYVLAYYGTSQRIYVFDTSTKLVTETNLPILGYFDLDDAPTCNGDTYCAPWPLGTISPDGKTLFFIGETKLVVAPIPTTLKRSGAQAPMQRAKLGAGTVPDTLVPLKFKH